MLLERLQDSRIGELERQNKELEARIAQIGWEQGKNTLLIQENTTLQKTIEAQALRIQQLEALLAQKQ